MKDKSEAEIYNQFMIDTFGTPKQEPNAERSAELAERISAGEDIEEVIKAMLEKYYFINYNSGKLYLPVSKLAKNAVALINGKLDGVTVGKSKKGENLITYCEQIYNTIENKKEITRRDVYINAAAASFWADNQRVITLEMLYRRLNGLTNYEAVRPQALNAIKQSVIKQAFLPIEIDCTEEARASGFDIDSWERLRAMLPCDIDTVTKNGRKVTAITLTAPPPIFLYSKTVRKKEIRTLTPNLLKIRGLQNSEQIETIKLYLLEQIESMRGNGRNSTILYKTIFEACALDLGNDKTRNTIKKRYRDYINIMLEQWKAEQFIKDFIPKKHGRVFTGFEVII